MRIKFHRVERKEVPIFKANAQIRVPEVFLIDENNEAIGVMPTKTNEFIIVFGNRRLAACKKLGWKKVPAMIGDKDMLLSELKISNLFLSL